MVFLLKFLKFNENELILRLHYLQSSTSCSNSTDSLKQYALAFNQIVSVEPNKIPIIVQHKHCSVTNKKVLLFHPGSVIIGLTRFDNSAF